MGYTIEDKQGFAVPGTVVALEKRVPLRFVQGATQDVSKRSMCKNLSNFTLGLEQQQKGSYAPRS
jgi:hypothetical protein